MSLDNKDQLDKLIQLVTQSQKQISVLEKISGASDSTSKAVKGLQELPSKLAQLSITLDTLNSTLDKEIKKLSESYSILNHTNSRMNEEQIRYLEKMSKVIDLANAQIKGMEEINKRMNEEFSRRVNISISAKRQKVSNGYEISSISISNTGNIECEVKDLALAIYNKDCICRDTAKEEMNVFNKEPSSIFRLKVNEVSIKEVIPGQHIIYPLNGGCIFSSQEIIIYWKLVFKNKYESKSVAGFVSLE